VNPARVSALGSGSRAVRWGEATDEPVREDAHPTQKTNGCTSGI